MEPRRSREVSAPFPALSGLRAPPPRPPLRPRCRALPVMAHFDSPLPAVTGGLSAYLTLSFASPSSLLPFPRRLCKVLPFDLFSVSLTDRTAAAGGQDASVKGEIRDEPGNPKKELKKTGRHSQRKEPKKKPSHLSCKLPFPEDLDISIIGKVKETEQDEELGDSFVAPLHSTALYSEAEEIFRPSESLIPSVVSTPPGKKARTSMEVIENQSEEEEGSIIGRTKKVLRKSRPLLDDDNESESISDRVTHLVKGMRKQKTRASSPVCSTNLPEKCEKSVLSNELFVAEKASLVTKNEAKTLRRGISIEKEKSQSQPLNPDSQYISSLEKKKRSTRSKAKSHIVLSAFEDTLVQYKQQVESLICQRAIDSFYSVFKEQFIKILSEVQKLKNLKRKNAKVITNINKKRKCLFEAQDQLIRNEPQLKCLQIKYEELKERKSSFTEATWFFSNLKQLHDDYAALNRQAPPEREEYDSSSLPALLFEARSISGAAQHLKKINSHLQQAAL